MGSLHPLCKSSRLLSRIKVLHKTKINLKVGLEVPTSAKNTKKIDAKTNNNLWQDAINKGMKIVKVPFKCLNKDVQAPVRYKKYIATSYLV